MPPFDLLQRFSILFLLSFIAIAFWSPGRALAADRTIEWAAPTANVDGSVLDDLAGFQVTYAAVGSPPASGTSVDVPDPAARSVVIDIPAGNWYIMVQAYDSSGHFSQFSEPTYWPIFDPSPMVPKNVGVN